MEKNEVIEQEIYKTFIESAEKNSERRITQNNIYLTINLAFISYMCTQNLTLRYSIILLVIGLSICLLWFLTILNYSKRNQVKYDIINESIYGKLYSEEWKRIKVLTSLTTYEKAGAILFAALYIALFVLKLF